MSEVEKILLVDDEPSIRESVQAYLSYNENWQVEVASDVKQAWDKINQQTPDLIVSDIMMPEVDGYEVCQFIKSNPEMAHIKVVFLSAKSKEEDIAKGYSLGADLYLTKPFSTRNLMKEIKSLSEVV